MHFRREQMLEAARISGVGDAEFEDMWDNLQRLVAMVEAERKKRGLSKDSPAFAHLGSMAFLNDSMTRH